MSETTRHWLRLKLTPGLGRRGMSRLMETFGDPAAALAELPDWRRAGIRAAVAMAVPAATDRRLDELQRQLEHSQVRLLNLWEKDYPAQLAAIPDPPPLLLLCGKLPETDMFGVVGSRKATPAGSALTRNISRNLAEHDICIVSGLARGIDAAAHYGALDGGGKTVAVLGCGIDQIYPPENRRLYQQIQEQGCLVSEYLPGTAPLAHHFPGRNRIISGLCKGLLVVEAAAGSGSLITVDFALQQGREVFAVPGGVDRQTSSGVNQLIKDGAQVVTEARDILEKLWSKAVPKSQAKAMEDVCADLAKDELTVYKNVDFEPQSVDDLTRRCALTAMEVSAILLHLELAGRVEQLSGGRYIRSRLDPATCY